MGSTGRGSFHHYTRHEIDEAKSLSSIRALPHSRNSTILQGIESKCLSAPFSAASETRSSTIGTAVEHLQPTPLPFADPGSSAGPSSIGRIVSGRTSYLGEPNPARCCRLPANAEELHRLSGGCIDPVCTTETICDECSNHEECCDNDDCVLDCGSDCGLSLGCDEFDLRADDNTYAFEDSHSELFGDQTAQTFGFGRSLPQLAIENTMIESAHFAKIPDDTMLSTFAGNGLNQSISGSRLQSNPSFQIPWAPQKQLGSPPPSTPSISNCKSASQGLLPSRELLPAAIAPFAQNNTSHPFSLDSTYDSSDPTDPTGHAHHDHINLLTEKSHSTRPFPPSLRCQWTDSDGELCGETLSQGNDMHEHLKSAHGVKSEVYCRWIGCSAGVRSVSPHRFASSVERHTWGHSGYRPYKCSACNEGFAAASVREEHFKNIHLRKKEYSCNQCSHRCTSATNLKRHKDDKHRAERFQCEFCNRNGKRRLFPRGPNLARHFRNCKHVHAQFPEAAAAGKAKADWLPPGFKRGHHGMDRAKVTPPNYLPTQDG